MYCITKKNAKCKGVAYLHKLKNNFKILIYKLGASELPGFLNLSTLKNCRGISPSGKVSL